MHGHHTGLGQRLRTVTFVRQRAPAASARRGRPPFSLLLVGFVLVGVVCGGVAFYFAVTQPGHDPGLPLPVTVRTLGIHALSVAAPLPALPVRPRPSGGAPRLAAGGTSTASVTTPAGRGEHPAVAAPSPEPAAEAPVLVPEGEQRP